MSTNIRDQWEQCRAALIIAIIDSIDERADYLTSIERTSNGDIPATGIALELFPWQGEFGLSLRLVSDFPLGESRYDSADWPHFNFTDGCKSTSIRAAVSVVTQIYERGREPGNVLRDMAHLAFMAGAEALLDPKVSRLLQQFGIDAPPLTDTFVSSPFQYIVTDVDQTVKANYCEIVLANRVTQRVLENRR